MLGWRRSRTLVAVSCSRNPGRRSRTAPATGVEGDGRISRKPGPDFIGIGLPASGTRWLYDSLVAHRAVRMPPIKELHFLDRGVLKASLERLQARPGWSLPRRHRRFIATYERSGLLEELLRHEAGFQAARRAGVRSERLPTPAEFDLYERLFLPFRPFATGEVTPAYHRLSDRLIESFTDRFPGVKYLLMVRNPVERFLSSLNKRIALGILTLEEADRRVEDALAGRGLDEPSPSRAFDRWTRHVGSGAVHAVLLDDVARDPVAAQRDIFAFLGLPTGRMWFRVPGNRKQGLYPRTVSVDAEALRPAFADEIRACRERFGGATLTW